MATPINYFLYSVFDDNGNAQSGATITKSSLTTVTGGALSTGLVTIVQANENVVAQYDPEANGEAIITTSVAKSGLTFTTLNASQQTRTFLAKQVLTASGVDLIVPETGVNMRQMVALIGSVCAAVLSGAGTGTIVIKAVNDSGTTRVTATTDAAGNRSAISLNIPT